MAILNLLIQNLPSQATGTVSGAPTEGEETTTRETLNSALGGPGTNCHRLVDAFIIPTV